MSQTLKTYKKMAGWLMGKWIFSKAVSFKAPFFSAITPFISELTPGRCRVQIKDRRRIRNHIGSINAGALCTLAELVGGLCVDASLPANLRWIPKQMTVQYTKMARGTLTGICEFDPQILQTGDVSIPFEIQDRSGDAVLKIELLFYLSHRK